MDLVELYQKVRKEDKPLSCAAVVVAAGSAQREALQHAMMALYRYNRSAEAYFAH